MKYKKYILMARSSKFYQLNDFILCEYEYEDLVSPTTISTQKAPFFTLSNTYTNQLHVLNTDNSIDLTGNVCDRSVLQISDTEMVSLDIDLPLSYLEYDNTVVETNIIFSPNINMIYDNVKIHLVSGYNFDNNIDGYVLKIEALSSGLNPQKVVWANQSITNSDASFNFNANPIRIGERLYDRFIEVQIPSIKWVNDQFYGTTLNTNTFGYLVSPNNKGYNQTNPLYITLYEIDSTRISNRFRYFKTMNPKTVTINQADEFFDLSATLQESDNGDYFEYYASYQGGFIEDYIFFLNNRSGGKWILIHDLILTEQIGVNFVVTDNLNSIQTADYDKPRIYRPVVQNSDIAFAFSIDYMFRLYNQVDGQQILKRASLTSYEPKKYGKELSKINLGIDPEIHKVYNQITDGLIIQTPPIKVTPIVDTKYVPTFFEKNTINLTSQTVYLNENGSVVSETTDGKQTVYGQGKLNLELNPFDNLFKFKVYTLNKDVYTSFDLQSTLDLQMVFVIASSPKAKGQQLFIDELKDSGSSNKSEGEVVFNITPENIDKITSSSNNNWYIINKTTNGFQRPLFRGTWTSVEDSNTEDQLKKQISNLQSLLEDEKKNHTKDTNNLKASLDKTTAELAQLRSKVVADLLATTKAANNKLKINTSTTQTNVSDVNPTNNGTIQVINTAASDPGVNNAQTVKNLIVPKFFRKGILKLKL